MEIRHEAPDPDVDRKVSAALFVETPQQEVVRIDRWSLAGLEWPVGAPDCPRTGTLSVPFQGVDITFPVRLSSAEEGNSVRLEGLSGRQRETLALFYRSLLSGRMASSDEVITSLDTPLDLVPMGETDTEQAQRPAKSVPRALRVALNVASYLLIAVMVVGIVGNNIFKNLDRIDIQHGRVLAPIAPAFPARSGYIQSVEVGQGDHVLAGDILIRVRDTKTFAELERVEAELTAATRSHERVLAGLQELEHHRDAENQAKRMAVTSRLYLKFVGGGGFDDIRQQWITLRGRNIDTSAQFDPLEIVTEMLVAEAELRMTKVTTLRSARAGLVEMLEANHVTAPSDGIVGEITGKLGQFLAAQQPVLSFEASSARATVGWVSERFAETIFIGMPATIGLNENGQRIQLKGSITDVRAGDHPERPGEFGIIVTVTADGLSAEKTRTRLRVGAPVNLEAKRQLSKRFKDWFARKVE